MQRLLEDRRVLVTKVTKIAQNEVRCEALAGAPTVAGAGGEQLVESAKDVRLHGEAWEG